MTAARVPSLIVIQRDRCGICGACVPVCGPGALTLIDTYLDINNARCTSCEKCLAVCPTHALSKVAAETVTVVGGGAE